MNNLYLSKYESNFLNINIGRNTNSSQVDFTKIEAFIQNNQVKLLRLKTDNQIYPDITRKLYQTGFPAHYSHTVLTFQIHYANQVAPKSYLNENLTFTKVTDNNKQTFYETILEGMSDDPIGYYKTPIIDQFITKKAELKCYASYYADYYSGKDFAKVGWLMARDNELVGAFVFELDKNKIFTSMACVKADSRNSKLFHDMKIFRQQYCVKHNIDWASNGSRMYNLVTPNLLIYEGYKLIRTETVMHIVPT